MTAIFSYIDNKDIRLYSVFSTKDIGLNFLFYYIPKSSIVYSIM